MPIQSVSQALGNETDNASLAFKNRVINGACLIDQRKSGATSNTAIGDVNSTTPVDMFKISTNNGYFVHGQNSTGIQPPPGFNKYIGISNPVAASNNTYSYILHYIEGTNVADMDFGLSTAKTSTLSFWVNSSVTGTFGVTFRNNGADNHRALFKTYTISQANTWEFKTIAFKGDTQGTWVKDSSSAGMEILWDLGTTDNNTYGGGVAVSDSTWVTRATNTFGVANTTKLSQTAGAKWNITGVQFESGLQITGFEHRSVNTELLMCQRYFEVLRYGAGGAPYTALSAPLTGSGSPWHQWYYKTTKRVVPTVRLYSGSWSTSPGGSTVNIIQSSREQCLIGGSGVYFFAEGTSGNISLQAESEL